MTIPQADLILLIRLLHDDLSPAEGIFVREKMADSLAFTERYHQVNAATRRSASANDLLLELDATDVDQVAQFVDERLPPAEQAKFEAACCENPSLLREVIATWRATRQPDTSIAPPSSFSRRMLNALPSESTVVNPEVDSSSHRISLTQKASVSRRSGSRSRPVRLQRRSQPRRPSTPWTTAAWVFGAIAAVVVLIVASQFMSVNLPNRIAEDGAADDARVPEPTVVDDSPPAVPLDVTPDELPLVIDDPSLTPQLETPKQDVADLNPSAPDEPSIPLPDSPRPEPKLVAVVGRWQNVTGVVAVRSSERNVWHGAYSHSAATALADSTADEILTFANSLATAELSGGAQLSLGAETLVRMIGRTSRTADSDDKEFVGEMELEYGRMAIQRLPDRQHMRIIAGGQTLNIRAVGSDAQFTIEQTVDRILCAIVRGTVQINEQRASSDRWLQLKSSRLTNTEPRAAALEWINGPAAGRGIPQQISEPLNRTDNVQTAAQTLLHGNNPLASRYAARVLIELADLRDPDEIPEPFIRAGVESGAEARRVALVQWILSSMEQRPHRSDKIWDSVLRNARGRNGKQPPMTEAARNDLRDIYVAAIQRADPDVNWLRRLTQQLQPSRHIFARESSKYFLEQILSEGLPEYDAGNPTRKSISAVTQKLRRWHNAGQ